jgi:rare lipoprotein A
MGGRRARTFTDVAEAARYASAEHGQGASLARCDRGQPIGGVALLERGEAAADAEHRADQGTQESPSKQNESIKLLHHHGLSLPRESESNVAASAGGRLLAVRRLRFLFALALVSCMHEEARPFVAPAPAVYSESQPTSDQAFVAAAAAPKDANPDEVGLATWYGSQFAGKKTANGERFDPKAMTAAHRHLPFGTWVDVRRPDTGSSIRVRINDRGPWGDSKRVIDLSRAAALELGIVGQGVVRVEIRVVHGPT